MEGVYLGGVIVDAMEDRADHVCQFQGVGSENFGLIDGEVD